MSGVELFDELSLDELRTRRSAKWRGYPAEVLPSWVAEMDFPLAEPIREVLAAALARHDSGYAAPDHEHGEAWCAFLQREFQWRLSPKDVLAVPDVMTGVRELLHAVTTPGDRLVINPPVYPPFFDVGRWAKLEVAPVPLARQSEGELDHYALDLPAIERAYAAPRARADAKIVHLLCSPHNPTGTVHSRASLEGLVALAARYDVLLISDEVHAPLTHPGATHLPLPTLSEEANRRSVVLTSASKTWNLPGFKAAVILAGSEEMRALVRSLPEETPWHSGHFGVLAAQCALRQGEPWRKRARATLDRNRLLLQELLREHLPAVRYTPPAAGYLAWLDCRALGLGDDPAKVFLKRGKVALSNGPRFGEPGNGFARLNLATSRELLLMAVTRMAAAVADREPAS